MMHGAARAPPNTKKSPKPLPQRKTAAWANSELPRARPDARDVEGADGREGGSSDLVWLATRLIVEEGLEAEAKDAVGP